MTTLPPSPSGEYVSMSLFEWTMGVIVLCFGSLLGMVLTLIGMKNALAAHLEEDKASFAALRLESNDRHRDNREDLRLLRADLSTGQEGIRRLLEQLLMKELDK